VAQARGVEIPLTEALVAMVDGADPVDIVQELMSRKAVAEVHG
jgi:glycerol-3-phosphate dehydrogenase